MTNAVGHLVSQGALHAAGQDEQHHSAEPPQAFAGGEAGANGAGGRGAGEHPLLRLPNPQQSPKRQEGPYLRVRAAFNPFLKMKANMIRLCTATYHDAERPEEATQQGAKHTVPRQDPALQVETQTVNADRPSPGQKQLSRCVPRCLLSTPAQQPPCCFQTCWCCGPAPQPDRCSRKTRS